MALLLPVPAWKVPTIYRLSIAINRVEDTDQARSTKESEAAVLRDLAWLGIKWDEGGQLPSAASAQILAMGTSCHSFPRQAAMMSLLHCLLGAQARTLGETMGLTGSQSVPHCTSSTWTSW